MAAQCAALVRMLREEGVEARQISTSPSLGPLSAAERIPGLRTLLRTVAFWKSLVLAVPRAEVVHVLGASYLYFFLCTAVAVVAGRLWGKRVVLNYRGGAARDFFQRWPRFVRGVCQMADCVIVPTKFLIEVFHEIGVPASVVPNIVDLSLFEFRKRERVKPNLLVTRNLDPIYNVETALLAFAEIQARYPDATLTCAGSGSLEAELRVKARSLGLRNVTFVGAVSHARMGSLYSRADIFLNPSSVDNTPNSILEAFASGLPVVTTDVGGVGHLVRHEQNGLLVPPKDPHAMARAVIHILEDPVLASRLAEEGRRAVESFTWPQMRVALYRAYGWRMEPAYA
jgi:glycosyltransferase involved in cell wall biosynthesis